MVIVAVIGFAEEAGGVSGGMHPRLFGLAHCSHWESEQHSMHPGEIHVHRRFSAPSARLHAANAFLLDPNGPQPSALPDARADRFQIPNGTSSRSTPSIQAPRHNPRGVGTARRAPPE